MHHWWWIQLVVEYPFWAPFCNPLWVPEITKFSIEIISIYMYLDLCIIGGGFNWWWKHPFGPLFEIPFGAPEIGITVMPDRC